MPTLVTVDEMRERFDIDSEIDDKRLTPHVGSASRRLRKWVGETVYADALLASPTDADRKEDLTNAEAHLAMHYALVGLNSALSGKGVVATSMSAEGREMRKYYTPKETGELAQMYLETANEIARDYLVSSDNPVPLVNLEVDDIEWRTSEQL